MVDGQQIYVPHIGEEELPVAPAAAGSSMAGKVNINTADVETLTQLKGIGEAKANAIVKYRKEVGKFKKVEDLLNVPGIGEGILDKVKPFLTL